MRVVLTDLSGNGRLASSPVSTRLAAYSLADLSLQKNLKLTERYVLELHGDAFNLTNTPQFTNPDGTLTDPNYGKVTGTQLDSQRQLQLAARFTF